MQDGKMCYEKGHQTVKTQNWSKTKRKKKPKRIMTEKKENINGTMC